MEINKKNVSYIRADDNKIINEKCITWIKKMDECLAVCTRTTGCALDNTHKICKLNNSDSYNRINELFT